MNKTFNFAEKCFAFFCNKNIKKWGEGDTKNTLSQLEIMSLQKKEYEMFWKTFGLSTPQDFQNKIIVDYGCGFGYDSLFMLQAGAKHVYCLEISDTRLTNQFISMKTLARLVIPACPESFLRGFPTRFACGNDGLMYSYL